MTNNCPPALALSMHADRELPATEAVAIELHLASCVECRTRLAALRSEAGIIAAALAHDAEPVVLPAYRRPVSRMAMAATAVGGMFVAILVAAATDLVSGLLQGPVTWFNPFDAGTFADLGVEAAIYLAKHGGAIMAALAKTALMAVFTTLVGWFAFSRRRGRGPLLLTALLAVVVLQPLPSQALEIRHDETAVFVPAGETIDDTLMAFGETVEITGDVTGDLIAVGRRVVISGHVGGQVFTAAKSVTITGEVDGSVLGVASDTVRIASNRIGRNVYLAGSTIELSDEARVASNAVVAGERVQLAGSIGRDVFGAGEDINVSGNIGGALTAYAEHVALLGPARVAGNVTAHVEHANDLTVSPSAVIGGKIETALMKTHAERNEYLTGEFYGFQLLRFAAAFFAGAILLGLVPSMRRISIDSTSSALIAGGIGLVTLVAAPIIALLVAFTIVGLPIGVFGLLLWGVGLYFAKIVVAYFAGARLLETTDTPRHYTVILAAGLAILIVVINLPFIGGVFSFLLEILGLGLLVLFLRGAYTRTAEQAA